jgi:hypothetical protein
MLICVALPNAPDIKRLPFPNPPKLMSFYPSSASDDDGK